MKTFFDSEDIYDCMNELAKSKVEGKTYRLIFKMNERIRIKIKTPVGTTETEEAGSGPSQGGVDAAILSSNSMGNGVRDTFTEDDKEVEYAGKIVLRPLTFMDDIGRLAADRNAAQYANDKLEDLMSSKGLAFNLDKSKFLIMGNKKSRRKIQSQLDREPLELCGKKMPQAKELKYLGDWVSFDLSQSVHTTVMKRLGVAKLAIYEIRAVVEDRRSEVLGGVTVGLAIWEATVEPMLYHNAETWQNISTKTIKVLKDLYLYFFRCLFRLGAGAPGMNYFWQCGMLTPDAIILKKKLNFFHHLANLPENSLANECFRIQCDSEGEDSLPSIVEEVKEHVSKIGDPTSVSKGVWKRRVEEFISNMTRKNLLESMKKYKKINTDEREPFERKNYLQTLNLEDARMRMRISMGMVNTVRSNFKQSYKDRSLTCQSCKGIRVGRRDENEGEKPIDSQIHLMEDCEAFEDIRRELNIQNDAGIVEFF